MLLSFNRNVVILTIEENIPFGNTEIRLSERNNSCNIIKSEKAFGANTKHQKKNQKINLRYTCGMKLRR